MQRQFASPPAFGRGLSSGWVITAGKKEFMALLTPPSVD